MVACRQRCRHAPIAIKNGHRDAAQICLRFAIVDRESFASACKFLICRREHAESYRNGLIETAAEHVMRHRANYFGAEALILAPA